MKSLTFYFKYAWRSLQRGGQRSFFAVLCIAVGVAAVVALQNTGFSIQNTIAGDARANARADVVVTTRQQTFNAADLAKIEKLKQDGKFTDFTTSSETGASALKPDGSPSNQFGSFYVVYVVEPGKYPFYGKVDITEPKGKTLRDVMTKPGQVVLSDKVAKNLGAKIGDKFGFEGDPRKGKIQLEVAAILSSQTPAPGSGQADFTGYVYVAPETVNQLFEAQDVQPNTVYLKTASTTEADTTAKNAVRDADKAFTARTSTEINEQLKQASKQINDALMYVGLLSLLIGSVGVVNTMLVVVGRRSGEIATIKTLGMESRQTVWLFMLESAILGFFGSVLGVLIGIIGSYGMAQVAEGFVGRQLQVSIYFQPIWMGLLVGIATAIVFGLLPAYSASKIPPAQVLRQKTNALPRISIIATIGIILFMTLLMGTLSGIILNGQIGLGITIAFITLVVCAILVLVFAGVLWLVGKIPLPFGLNYKMARRNLSRGRAKSAVTLLVMMVGIFSVALVFILSSSLKDTIGSLIEKGFGYNMQAVSLNDQQADAMFKALDDKQVPGVTKYTQFGQASVRLVSAGGASVEQLLERFQQKQGEEAFFNPQTLSTLVGTTTDKADELVKLKTGKFFSGNNDVTIDSSFANNFDIKIGDKLVYSDQSGRTQLTYEVVGIHEARNFIFGSNPVMAANSDIRKVPGHFLAGLLTIEKGKLGDAEKYLKANFSGLNVTDLSFITNVFNSIIDQVTAFPVLLAMLSLIAGGVLIANNVALAVLERRTEMGVMKSLGADSSRVLNILNWENGIIGFLGGFIGFGIASLVGAFVVGLLGTPEDPAVLSISPLLWVGMLGLAVGLAIFATIASAWGAVREKPLVVLRYE
jgi:putative ABC transport system permease protein